MRRNILLVALVCMVMAAPCGTAQALTDRPGMVQPVIQTMNEPSAGELLTGLQALEARIDAGAMINGAKDVRLARAGSAFKASSATFSLAPTPSELSTEGGAYGCGADNKFCWYHPLLFSSNDPTLRITSAVSSNSQCLEVVTRTVGNVSFFLRGQKEGTVTLTVIASNGKTATKKITVKGKVLISSFSIYAVEPGASPVTPVKSKTVTCEAERTAPYFYLYAVANPTSASFAGYFAEDLPGVKSSWAALLTSSDPSVAMVSAHTRMGDIWDVSSPVYICKPGKATISVKATDGGKAKASLQVTAKGAPVTGITMSGFVMQPGISKKMQPVFTPSGAWDQSLTWSTNNKKAVTVDSKGTVTAVAPGNATITCRNSASRKSASATVIVSYSRPASGTTYRFYGISLASNTDMALLGNAFSTWYGSRYATVLGLYLSCQEARSALESIPSGGMDEDDVTVVVLEGYGTMSNKPDELGAFYDFSDPLKVGDTLAALEKVPGTVVLIVDSDYSGAYISGKGAAVSKTATLARQKAFCKAWTDAFSSSKATNYVSKGVADSSFKSKFKILTACGAFEKLMQNNHYYTESLFFYWLLRGLGADLANDTYNAPPANVNASEDLAVTLNEAYRYVRDKISAESKYNAQQTVGVWPANDPTAILNATS